MIHLKRGPAPEFWTRAKVKEWTEHWLAKDCKSDRWQWPQVDNKKLNEYAREAMPWQYNKCAFCEAPLGKAEIEHFRAKTKHPLAAFVWRNLFFICRDCNSAKGEKSHEGCLKPDREDPLDYLTIDVDSLKIKPKSNITPEAKKRAERTIEVYDLNRSYLIRFFKMYLGVRRGKDTELLWIGKNMDPNLLVRLQTLVGNDMAFSLRVECLLEHLTS